MPQSTINPILKWINENFDEVVLADGLEDALIGVVPSSFDLPDTAIYDVKEVINILINQGMTDEDAWEWFSFNIEGAYVKGRPLFMRRPPS